MNNSPVPPPHYTLKLAHLYARHMNLYGDRGNVLALYRRAQWRGIHLEIIPIEPGPVPATLADFDFYFMGGGQDAQQLAIEADLHAHKARALQGAAALGAVFLTICGGYQLMGHYYQPHEGAELKGLSLIDAHTIAGRKRMIGNIALKRPNGDSIAGFENHSGKTWLGQGVSPLGKVVTGGGNNGEDGSEGVCQGNLYGTYLHGSLLPKNPALTDELLLKALNRRYGVTTLPPLPVSDLLEQAAHDRAMALGA